MTTRTISIDPIFKAGDRVVVIDQIGVGQVNFKSLVGVVIESVGAGLYKVQFHHEQEGPAVILLWEEEIRLVENGIERAKRIINGE